MPVASDTRMKEENDKLKAELEEVKARLSSAEVIIKTRRGQEAQLRDSIMIAKREVCSVLPPARFSVTPDDCLVLGATNPSAIHNSTPSDFTITRLHSYISWRSSYA